MDDSTEVLNIETAAFVAGVGHEAIRKALRKAKIKKLYRMSIGQTATLLLPREEVERYWLEQEGDDPWIQERWRIVEKDSFVIRSETEDVELKVLAGQCVGLSQK